MSTKPEGGSTRRDFLKAAGVTGAAAMAANLGLLSNVHAQGTDVIRVGLIGCGGRGTGAAEQCVRGGANVRLVAMGDAFRDRLDGARNNLMNNRAIANRVDVPANRCFVGLNAYEQV